MPPRTNCTASDCFSIRDARSIVRDLFEPKPAIYWADFLLSMVVGGICFYSCRQLPPLSAEQLLLALASACAYYRASLFIHELTHLRKGSFQVFRITWNLLCGIPFFMPSFLYYTHVAHHARKHYGTPEDGEYLPLGTSPRREILKYLLQPLVIPFLALLRFMVFTPLAWLSPRFRRFVQQHASSMVMDPRYVRPLPSLIELRTWRLQEAACFLYGVGAAWLFFRGRLPPTLFLQAYLTAVVVLYLNHLRTLGAHRFRYGSEPSTFVEQLLDSVNYPRWPLVSELWAPVGLRYHALHHLFPSLPYHALPEAHRRLMRELPSDSPYRQTESTGLLTTLYELWQVAGRSSVQQPARNSRPTDRQRAGGSPMSPAV